MMNEKTIDLLIILFFTLVIVSKKLRHLWLVIRNCHACALRISKQKRGET
ncbi:hypothetical protein [Enterococcus hirae]|uniref:Uncharacterized protein n=1 Tax=Enterococcus hirae (strain ATCC 9790 / DSM 20160 / JCM 8729 / LMG 6399 / NBRC 3181 / NCIMB 6459 / NCDO 1258 / NCTC 12367 / WDCM 00089 / R) TaxID=768486 RepID=I6T7K8_ENTHA|nr:hypothetical protein [Enterococcus hirae]AFM69149.1 hypothetical protein EHR_00775 [Enterococcus hirae ATCC 9790]